MLLSLEMYCWSVPPTMLKPSPKVSQRESWWEKAQSFRHSCCCWGLYPPSCPFFLHHTKTHSTQICIILSNHHCLEKFLSWSWSWNQKRDPECLRAHKASMSCFQMGVGEYWGTCHCFWDADSAPSRNTPLQHSRKGKETILHFTGGYGKPLPLNKKKSCLTSVSWAGKQS